VDGVALWGPLLDRLNVVGEAEVWAHHRLRGGITEDTMRALKNDFGMIHAPVQPFFGNLLYWQAAALAHNVALWIRHWDYPKPSAVSGASGYGWDSSTSLPAWSATAEGCTCASALPTGTCRPSRPRWTDC